MIAQHCRQGPEPIEVNVKTLFGFSGAELDCKLINQPAGYIVEK